MTEPTSFDLGQVLTNQFGERYLQEINGESFSRTGSIAFFKQHYNEKIWGPDRLNIVLGTDSGLLVHYIHQEVLKPDSGIRVLFIELPDVLERLEKEGMLPEPIKGRVEVTTPENWMERAKETFNITDYFYLDAIGRLESVGALDAIHPGYLSVWDSLTNEFLQIGKAIIMQTGNHVFARTGLQNLSENRLRAKSMHGLFEGKSAVILAGGPSLSEAYEMVKANRDNLVVMAVARVAKNLQQHGIVPDFIFSIDPHELSFNNSREMLHYWEKTFFINLYHVCPMLLGQWQGRSAYLGSLYPWKNEFDAKEQLQGYPGITVSHQALGCAIDMGFSRIILCGIDLCFSKEGFTHVQGSLESDVGPFLANSRYQVETNNGEIAETRYDFFSAIPALAQLALYAEEHTCQLINPAPLAAKIERVEHKAWDDLTFEPLGLSVSETLDVALPEDSRANRLAHYEMVLKELTHARSEVTKVRKLAEEGLACNKRLFGKKGKQGDYSAKLRMDQVEEDLDKKHPVFSTMVKQWGIKEFLRLIRPDKDKGWTDEEIEQTGERYYKAYKQSAQSVLQFLNETIRRVQIRQEEEKPKPNLKNLFKQWEEDQQPNRLVLLEQRSAFERHLFPAKMQERFEAFDDSFKEQMTHTETTLKKRLKAETSPMTARNKLRNLFRQNNKEMLTQLRTGILGSQFDFKEDLAALANGYIHELKEDFEVALGHYEQVERKELLEEAKTRILQILLKSNRIEESLPVLDAMSAHNPGKLPYYATMLGLTGRIDAAKLAFNHYLGLAPNDLITRLKYAQMLEKNQLIEEAKIQVEQILAKDDSNQAAKQMLQQFSGVA
ncbi:6-hydroxymethylpterin diphosphokinase MptE-like protein [Magnetococcus sp. PR-3]|uniref:6-hydroxymethylpterin diphosphokinase MptE-like protein n=1 Tax=Magnetococcus sp. PR-3 TaxID=3120355 RepID=UPI002FCE3692